MIESIVSEIGSIKELLDKEINPEFFDREFSFLATAPTLLYLADTSRIIYANRLFTDASGYTVEDLALQQYTIQQLFPALQDIETVIQAQEIPALHNLQIKDGGEIACRVHSRLLYKDCYVIQLIAEPGHEKSYSKGLFDEQAKKLALASKELEEFAYIASHDLQEPLRKITTFIQRLQQKLGETKDEDIELYIKRIQVSADNMRNLIDNLLEFSRAGRNTEPVEEVDLSSIISETVSDVSLKVAETGTVVHTGSLPVLEAVPSQMIQLFRHVLHNAIKFRKQDVPLEVTIDSKELAVDEIKKYQLPAGKDYYMITVADSGIGFEQEYAEKIFQLFQRLHGKHEYPGTGIGLSICKKIVNKHGGSMFAESVPGEGSRFCIILPKHQTKDV